MSINISQERLLSLSEAARSLPKINGHRPAVSTIWRWCTRGLDGVYLGHVRLGKRCCTSAEALSRFANELAEARRQALDSNRAAATRPTTTAPMAARTARAKKLLNDAGI